ncbi:ergothioneine biosynthesis protein EgtB [Polynucleobacter sp. JS-Safj-400b-B2]|uniref:ergothioneine biosynthesis protein EgtB n=1 Tax=Polynucleobacter sp. JS-Safj-400b-B2 TaxID=2576921 RepID=UPI001C0CC440|nr:ergothioneine biosynthesis protein EgtB [Polynucleobacter sp. JS-Safj-400b-B2]MBU3627069.1 ergothioneine biosynthesis protein EgtB [Polynucleobacter sp. JS-Safj-400b-B2]
MQNNLSYQAPSADELLIQFHSSRKYSVDLIANLSAEDCQAQSMEDASPAKWHLAHVTWFYEVMVLRAFEKNFSYWNPEFAVLFNSYYNGVGDKHPRSKRGLLTRPSLQQVLEWRKNIEDRLQSLLKENSSKELLWLIQLGINHEQQHQELLLTDIQHLFSNNSLWPIYNPQNIDTPSVEQPFKWIEGISGLVQTGHSGNGFHFDNEGPQHSALNQTHSIGNRLVSNSEWLQFIEDGGYDNFQWWLDAGWAWLKSEKISAPLYWNKDGHGQLLRFSLNGNTPLDLQAPVSNISYFEADAFARWSSQNFASFAGARLPTENEWESFAQSHFETSNDLFGKVWQWTSSNYAPYPGYKPWGGIAGEYNGKFMVNQMVLKGSSAYTPKSHSRITYRNFFPTHARWQMTGLRLAKDGI